jgi:hypothetical protein
VSAWLAAFAFTQAVEVPLYTWALRRRRVAALWAFGASALTHPVVWFVMPQLSWPGGYWGYVAAAETFAVGVEALYLRSLGVRWPLLWALLANGASASLGLASRAWFGWP